MHLTPSYGQLHGRGIRGQVHLWSGSEGGQFHAWANEKGVENKPGGVVMASGPLQPALGAPALPTPPRPVLRGIHAVSSRQGGLPFSAHAGPGFLWKSCGLAAGSSPAVAKECPLAARGIGAVTHGPQVPLAPQF